MKFADDVNPPCGAIFPCYSAGEPKDSTGCLRENSDCDGVHVFVDEDNKTVLWETDMNCPCCGPDEDGNDETDGDWCATYKVLIGVDLLTAYRDWKSN